jgi:hypothetical protein
MKARGKWQGMSTIARFNWPFYVVAGLVLIASTTGYFLLPGFPLKLGSVLFFIGAAWFIFGSLGVSHYIYDRSDLYRWEWLDRALQGTVLHHAVFCHCGFDEASAELRDRFQDAKWQVIDHFDQSRMTEASIRRARALFPAATGTLSAPHNAWPLTAGSTDLVFGLLAIHELRSEAERSAWFAESRRSLRQGGRIVLVEHVRDIANFLAFGPGFLHFHSAASWRRCWESAGFRSIDRFSVTQFIQVFVLSIP